MYDHLIEKIKQVVANNKEQILSIRRHIHQYPELAFKEFKTAQFIGNTLKALGIEVSEGIANTGLVANIQGKYPSKRTIVLRADIDALPIQEKNQTSYKSKIPGVMHACGHDVHTASLIGTAQVLHALKEEFEGTIRLLFQPAEEELPGGAVAMIQEGVLQNPIPHCILGQHVNPTLPVGYIGFTKGTVMASTDELHITVKGQGGHAASPHKAVDAILIASHLIVALQQLMSRNKDPLAPGVLSICQIRGGDTTNVIPESVYLAGTLRGIDEVWRQAAHQKIKTLCENMAQAMGGVCDVMIKQGYPSTYNEPLLTSRLLEIAKQYVGHEHVLEMPTHMAGEDFGYYAQQVPGCFYFLGVSNVAQGINSSWHTPTFDVDEKALEIGAGLMAWLAIHALESA